MDLDLRHVWTGSPLDSTIKENCPNGITRNLWLGPSPLVRSPEERDELYEDDVNRLEQLADKWITNEILGKQLALDDIDQILRKLTSSSIPRSKLHRFEMLLKDIRSNRFRVYDLWSVSLSVPHGGHFHER